MPGGPHVDSRRIVMAACKNLVNTRQVVVVILGSTGTGKSKLALQIAQKFGGEIISADSMQVYTGLDIITNKVTREEQEIATHHMLDFLQPWQQFTVVDFRNKALPVMKRLLSSQKLPIVVGGTYYYVESLLWKVLVSKQDDPNSPLVVEKDAVLAHQRRKVENENGNKFGSYLQNIFQSFQDFFRNLLGFFWQREVKFSSVFDVNIDQIENKILHEELKRVDPEFADQIHPNDRRKVIRGLQVFEVEGRKLSDIHNEQRSQQGGSSLGGPLRFPKAVIFWLQCDQNVLNDRLDDRVDEMVSRGLVVEIVSFYKQHKEHITGDYTTGILQSIGFKEFTEYLALSESQRNGNEGRASLEKGIEQLKLATRRYSKKQTKWINNRFLRCPDRQTPSIYGLDVTDLKNWDDNVMKPAFQIIDACVQGNITSCPMSPLPPIEAVENKNTTFVCTDCNVHIVGEMQWESHVTSYRHEKRMMKNKRRQAAQIWENKRK